MAAPKDFTKGVTLSPTDGKGLRVGIIRARWNDTVVSKLLEGCVESLHACGVEETDIIVQMVPGSFEVRSVAAVRAAGRSS